MPNPHHLDVLNRGVRAWNQWRKEQSGVRPDLSQAKLSLMDLRLAILSQSNLAGADLRGSLFGGADLSESSLRGARLEGATFTVATTSINVADFYGLDHEDWEDEKQRVAESDDYLQGSRSGFRYGPEIQGFRACNLSSATLEGANFSRAILAGVVLKGVTMARAVFSRTSIDCSLADVGGLDDTVHSAPSQITTAALSSLRTPLPEEFLRGIGLQDWQIQAARTHGSSDYYSCFISYSHKDSNFARRLHDRLQDRGIRCWLDEHQMLPGDDIYEQVERGIKGWDKTLLCCSSASLTSWWVDNEVDTAFSKERALIKERGRKVLSLVPINLDNYLFSDSFESGKKQQLTSRLAADFVGWESEKAKFDEAFEKLLEALRADAKGREAPPPSKL